jgi:hypothetical protein
VRAEPSSAVPAPDLQFATLFRPVVNITLAKQSASPQQVSHASEDGFDWI